MNAQSDDKLDRLLEEAYSTVEVSSDFTLRLWHRLMNQPTRFPWALPVPVCGLAAAVGVLAGVWSWSQWIQPSTAARVAQSVRLDLFGNAPVDSVAGGTLMLMEGVKT